MQSEQVRDGIPTSVTQAQMVLDYRPVEKRGSNLQANITKGSVLSVLKGGPKHVSRCFKNSLSQALRDCELPWQTGLTGMHTQMQPRKLSMQRWQITSLK